MITIERNIEQQTINYEHVMNLGFKRQQQTCPIFYAQYGFIWFVVDINLTTEIYIDWDCVTRTCTMHRCDKDPNEGGHIQSTFLIKDLEELKQIIKFFKY